MGKSTVKCKECGKEEVVFNSRAKTYKYCSMRCMSKSFTSISFNIGDRINNWIILDDVITRKYGRAYVKAQCQCGSGIIKDVPIVHLETKKHKGCEKCSRFHTSKGYRLISGEYWSLIENSAKKRNIEFNITKEYVWELYVKQEGKCNLSGVDIEFEPNCVHNKKVDNRRKRTVSLDRINSSEGYVEGNVQWVHKDVNIMKNKYNNEYFIEICKKIWEKNSK